MMEHNEEMFLETLKDIESKLTNTTYDVVKSCGLLRQLLFENSAPLVTILNEKYQIKPKFTVTKDLYEHFKSCGLEFSFVWNDLIPLTAQQETITLTLGQFRNHPVFYHGNVKYTVYDTIDVAAHILGGIHSQIAKTEKEKTLVNIFQNVDPTVKNGLNTLELMFPGAQFLRVMHGSIRSICKVCLEALNPLKEAIITDSSSS